FYKTLTLFAKAETAGMLCGTTAPIVVASRADSGESKFNSLALACLADKVK
ncbi:MAG: phosphate butyryltransferase, partial [Segatella copri]